MSGFDDVRKRRCVLLDFDGTLADTKQTICHCARIALSELGMTEREMGDLTRLIGPPFPQAYEEVYGMSAEDAAFVTDRYREIWDSLDADAIPLFPGVPDMLDALRASGKVVAVATSKAQNVIEDALVRCKIEDAFDLVVGKPHEGAFTKAETIEACLERLKVPITDAVMVGDRYLDVEGAHLAGIPAIGVTWGGVGTAQELEEAAADMIVDSVSELTYILCDREV
jgi:phosphoglycolate phosphatase